MVTYAPAFMPMGELRAAHNRADDVEQQEGG